MQIKLTGEQPFQVLSTTFTIGPSTSGYDLYFSADGVNYTQLFTVGANVNRQVTQVAAGSYYKLVGNTGNVVVNWYGNCVVDSGGGGGYVLPVASQNTLGGVKIGSGITIDSGGTISAQGGGAEIKTVELSNINPTLFTQEDISAMTEMVEYLADFPVNGLPMARIGCDGMYYTLVGCVYDPEDAEEQTPEQRYKYIFTYADAWNASDEFTDESDNGFVKTFYLDIENVEDSYHVWWGNEVSNNYYIVDDVDNAPVADEGKMAYVKEYVKSELEGTKIYIDDFSAFTESTEDRAEGYLARVHWGDWEEGVDGEEDLVAFPIYQSGNAFHWDFENDGQFHDLDRERDGEYYKIRYRTFSGDDGNGSEAYIEIYPIDETPYGDYIISYSNYVTGETTVYEEIEPGNKYTYRKVGDEEAWVKQQDSHYLYIGDGDNPEASEEDRIAFYNAVMANIGDNWYMDITRDGGAADRYYYEHTLDNKPVFCYDAGNGLRRGYALNADGTVEYYHEDRPDIPTQAFIQIDSAGTMNTETLSTIAGEQPYRVWLRYDSQSLVSPDASDSSYAPLKYCYRQYEEISDEVKLVYYIGGEIYIGGTLYKGAWHFIEWEWGDQPIAADTWTTV